MRSCRYRPAFLLVGALPLALYSLSPAQAVPPGATLDNVKSGIAVVEGEGTRYFYVKATFSAKGSASLTFRQDSCVLFGSAGAKVADAWISLAGWSAGLSMSQTAPVDMKTLAVSGTPGGPGIPSFPRNTSQVAGPAGALTYDIPAGGHVDFYVLWPVTPTFRPVKAQLGPLGSVSLR
jgi:hypothetical protein